MSSYEQNNMKNLVNIFQNPDIIGVNKKYSLTPNVNETLIIISKSTKYVGKFITSTFGLFATLVVSTQSSNSSIILLFFLQIFLGNSCWLNIHKDPTKNIVNADQLIEISQQQELKKFKQEQLSRQFQQLELDIKELEISIQSQKINQDKITSQYQKEENELKLEIENKKRKKLQRDEELHFFETQYQENNQIDRLKNQYNEKLNNQIKQIKDELNRKFNSMKYELDKPSDQLQQQLQAIEQQYNECNNQNSIYQGQISSVKALQKTLKEDLDQLTSKLNSLKMQNATLKHDQTTLSLTSTYIQPTTGINTDLMCIICGKRPRVMINLPCGHISHCAVCQKSSQAGKHKVCWICAERVRKAVPRKLIEIAINTTK